MTSELIHPSAHLAQTRLRMVLFVWALFSTVVIAVAPSLALGTVLPLAGTVSLVAPGVGLYLLAASVPLEDVFYVRVAELNVKPYEIILLALLASLVLRRSKLRLGWIGWGLLLYAMSGIVTLVNSTSIRDSVQVIIFETLMVLVALAVRWTIRSPGQLRRIVLFWIVSTGGLVSIYGLGQFVAYYLGFDVPYFHPEVYPIFRPYATFIEPNFYGNFAVCMLVTGLCLYASPAFKRQRSILLAVSALQFIMLILNLSRAPWVGLVASLGIYGLMYGRHHRRFGRPVTIIGMNLVLFLGFMLALYAASPTGWATVVKRLNDTVNPVGEGAAQERMRDMQLSLELWRNHPLIGNGVGTWGAVAYGLTGRDVRTPPRNIFLAWLYEKGLIGTAIAVATYGAIAWKAWQAHRYAAEEAARALVTALALGMFAVFVTFQFTRIDISPFYWFQAGLLLATLDQWPARGQR